MKENKFILILVVCVIVLCRFWELFVFPNVAVDVDTTVLVTEQTASKNDTAQNTGTNADAQVVVSEENAPVQEVSVPENADATVAQEKQVQKNDAANKNFVGCKSSFSSHRTTNRLNGETTRNYSAKNIIVCDCGFDGKMFSKKVIYEYASEPQKVELDCNSKCGEICAQN